MSFEGILFMYEPDQGFTFESFFTLLCFIFYGSTFTKNGQKVGDNDINININFHEGPQNISDMYYRFLTIVFKVQIAKRQFTFQSSIQDMFYS